jgi:hypothetical protein
LYELRLGAMDCLCIIGYISQSLPSLDDLALH